MKVNGLSLFCSSISIELLAELLSDVFSARVLIALAAWPQTVVPLPLGR